MKKNKNISLEKKVFILGALVAIVMTFLIFGGKHTVQKGYVSSLNTTYWNANYDKLDGPVSETIDPRYRELSCGIHGDKGWVTVKVTKGLRIVYLRSFYNDGQFDIKLPKRGKIRITVTGHNHKGGFMFNFKEPVVMY